MNHIARMLAADLDVERQNCAYAAELAVVDRIISRLGDTLQRICVVPSSEDFVRLARTHKAQPLVTLQLTSAHLGYLLHLCKIEDGLNQESRHLEDEETPRELIERLEALGATR